MLERQSAVISDDVLQLSRAMAVYHARLQHMQSEHKRVTQMLDQVATQNDESVQFRVEQVQAN